MGRDSGMYQVIRVKRMDTPVMRQKKRGELEYLSFDILERTGMVEHLFTTRMGGCSEGMFSSMNLSFSRGDSKETVIKNYQRIADTMGWKIGDMVASHQTHTVNIRRVTAEDRGKGVILPRNYEEIDGLITNERNVVLATFFADCVPLYFVDTEHRAIGLAHSGWRGTVAQMGSRMVSAMQEQFGSRPEGLIAAIGPSICKECYEVGEEVAQSFCELLQGMETDKLLREIARGGYYTYSDGRPAQVISRGKTKGKYQLDLWLANLIILRNAGIPLDRIAVTDVCTCHNPNYLFSHRASNGKRGNLGAFLKIN